MVDPVDDANNGPFLTSTELAGLIEQIVFHPVYLLDHRLCQNLHFDTDFDIRYGPAPDGETFIRDCRISGNNRAKRPVSAAVLHSMRFVLHVEHAALMIDSVNKLARVTQSIQVFEDVLSDTVAMGGHPMKVRAVGEERLKLREQR